MKKILLMAVAALFVGPSGAMATAVPAPQDEEHVEAFKKERRIYLWDVTISMVGATKDATCPKASKRTAPDYAYNQGFPNYNSKKDIFNDTRAKLIKMIYETQVESTEIIVLPFRNGIVGEIKGDASVEGKAKLKKAIMEWNDLQAGGTFTATCLKEAVNKFFTKDKINRIFLLTDGEPSNDENAKLLAYLRNWKGVKETKGTSSYLVYVMLTDEAFNQDLVDISNGSDGDILVTEEFENPVWISINKYTSIHVRDFFDGKISSDGKGYIEIPYSYVQGNTIPQNSIFRCVVEENDYLKIDSSIAVTLSDGIFKIPFQLVTSFEECLANLLQDSNFKIKARLVKDSASNKNIDITGGNVFEIALVVKSEPRVKISWTIK